MARGKNSSRGTLPAFNAVAPRIIFQPSIDHALSKSVSLVSASNSLRGEGHTVGTSLSGKRLEVCMNSRAFVDGIAFAAGTILCTCACIYSAKAADLPPVRAPAVVPAVVYAPPVYNWSGFYVGGNLGAGFANSSWTDPFTGAHDTFSKDGFIGGGQVGANWQINALVLGILRLDLAQRQRSGFARQHDQHGYAVDVDSDRTHWRRFRPPPGLRQGRRCLRP